MDSENYESRAVTFENGYIDLSDLDGDELRAVLYAMQSRIANLEFLLQNYAGGEPIPALAVCE